MISSTKSLALVLSSLALVACGGGGCGPITSKVQDADDSRAVQAAVML